MEGPRPVNKSDVESLINLTDKVFWKGLVSKYPQLFNEDNFENLRVFSDSGQIVSHVGFIERKATILGSQIMVACIGAVATLPEYRGKGLATQLMEDSLNKMLSDGVDIVLVSGGRGLYKRHGCTGVGRFYKLVLKSHDITFLPSESIEMYTLKISDIPAAMELYEVEPVRFLRPREDYEYFLQSHWAMNKRAELFIIERKKLPVAYVVLRFFEPAGENENKASIAEFAGDRIAVLSAIKQLFQSYRLSEIELVFQEKDNEMKVYLSDVKMEIVPFGGTLRVLNFKQLMERLMPYFSARLGDKQAKQLVFNVKQGTDPAGLDTTFEISLGNESVSINGYAEIARLIFGSHDREFRPAPSHFISRIFPLPALWYGLNYV